MTKLFLAIVGLVAWVGFVGPTCMSSESDILCVSYPLATLGGVLFVVSKFATKNKGESK